MTNSAWRFITLRAVLIVAIAGAPACHLERARSSDGVESASLPEDMRHDYALFAQRCSKCHALARPLQSGITDDDFWENYVERMRRQPGSGITPDEVPHILRFLSYYSSAQRSREGLGGARSREVGATAPPINARPASMAPDAGGPAGLRQSPQTPASVDAGGKPSPS